MKANFCSLSVLLAVLLLVVPPALAEHHEGEYCQGFGPQTPRDIDNHEGENLRIFSMAPSYEQMNLCNIHFHKNAEHKAAAFSIYAGEGQGYRCGMSETLTAAEKKATSGDICGGLKPGDTIEVHWVHTSCDITPGPTLGACLSDACVNPNLRVETQVFTLVNDSSAAQFGDFDLNPEPVNGYHQAKAIPSGTGTAVEFLGSTTGPSFTEQTCSPLQVSWSVRPECAKLDINSVGKWCEGNAFDEDHAHGVREIVTNPHLLSKIH